MQDEVTPEETTIASEKAPAVQLGKGQVSKTKTLFDKLRPPFHKGKT